MGRNPGGKPLSAGVWPECNLSGLFLENPDQGKYFSNYATLDSSGTRSYNGLLLSLQGRIRTGFTVLANHTWAHCIDYGITTNQTTIQTWDLSQRSNHRGNCELDRRQNFNLSAVYQTPQFTNHVAKTLATGWQVSTVTRALTGPWVSVQTGVNNSLTGTSDQFPNIVAGVSPYAANRGAKSRIWLNPAAFSQPVAGTYGNMASQSIQGPGSFNVDVALARLFRIKEGLTVQLRAEAFNVLNHVNPGGATAPASGMNNAGLNSAATLRSGIALTLTDPLFGRIVNAADPRIMQLAMKLTF